MAALDGKAIYYGDSGLSASDGTTSGTVLLKAGAFDQFAAVAGGILYFGVQVLDNSGQPIDHQLWKTDGTVAGTALVTDLGMSGGLNPSNAIYFPAAGAIGNTLFFFAHTTQQGPELWKTDGTAAGTAPVTPVTGYVNNFVVIGNEFYFTTSPAENSLGEGNSLWKSDGTAAGAVQILGPLQGGYVVARLTVAGNKLFYATFDPNLGISATVQIFVTDGTAAGTSVGSVTPAEQDLNEFHLVANGTSVYFLGQQSEADVQVYRTDGSSTGIVEVTNQPGGVVVPQTFIPFLAAAGGRVYYTTSVGLVNGGVDEYQRTTLWETDGTGNGTAVRTIQNPGGVNFGYTGLTAAGSTVYFTGYDPVHGNQLWKETTPPKAQIIALGAGTVPEVKVYNAATGALKFDFLAYAAAFRGGVRVAVGDVNGDGVADIITGAGPGGGPHVEVFDGRTGQLIRSFFAYAPNFTGGVFVASADIDGDGYADIITGAGAGGGPHVEVFSGKTGQLIRSFFAYDAAFHGGVTVAAGDVDGTQDIITGAGPGGGPHVRVFDGLTGAVVQQFFAFAPTFAGGVSVAAADTNADGNADLVVGAGPGYSGGPVVDVYSGLDLSRLASFAAYDPRFSGGVWVAAADFAGTGAGGIVTAPGTGGGPDVRVLGPGVLPSLTRFNAFNPAFLGGVFVG